MFKQGLRISLGPNWMFSAEFPQNVTYVRVHSLSFPSKQGKFCVQKRPRNNKINFNLGYGPFIMARLGILSPIVASKLSPFRQFSGKDHDFKVTLRIRVRKLPLEWVQHWRQAWTKTSPKKETGRAIWCCFKLSALRMMHLVLISSGTKQMKRVWQKWKREVHELCLCFVQFVNRRVVFLMELSHCHLPRVKSHWKTVLIDGEQVRGRLFASRINSEETWTGNNGPLIR